MIKKIV